MSMPESDAAYYQAHKDDPDEWDDPTPPRRIPRRRLAAMISVRFTPAELELLRQAAGRRGESLSAFVRSAALGATFRPFAVASTTGIQAAENWLQGTMGQDTAPRSAVVGLPRRIGETTGAH